MESKAPPQYPILSCDGHDHDERTEGVHLLEWGDDSKTTAERRGDSWRITEWDTHQVDGQTHWFPRWFHTIPDSTVRQLAALIADEEA